MSDLRIVYSTFPNEKEAQAVADKLVVSKLAACVNLFQGLSSTYEWKGKLHREKEVVLLAKTTKKLALKTMKKIEELHSYECPCVAVFKSSEVNKKYMTWVKEQV